jgi:DNA ligase-1
VQYWVYDAVVDKATFEQRKGVLELVEQKALWHNTGNILVVGTYEVETGEQMQEVFTVFLNAGFEGAMLRNKNGLYKHGRSYDLQKVKVFQDAEFEVVAVEEGRGKMAGLAMFVCKTDEGQTFRVKMKGTLESLRSYYENPQPWIGKMLTVQFQKWSAEGLPIFPVALRFREDV